MTDEQTRTTRREFLSGGIRGACLLGLGGAVGLLAGRARSDELVWQIDPYKCNQCGNCATYCVLKPSAVKCVHSFALCGYCLRCFAFFDPNTSKFDSAAENQLCPTGAIARRFVEDPYYEYTIDEKICIGCGKCAKGCNTFGNGSLYLQVRHDRCLNCNECAIAVACPSNALVRVPADTPYLFKKPDGSQ